MSWHYIWNLTFASSFETIVLFSPDFFAHMLLLNQIPNSTDSDLNAFRKQNWYEQICPICQVEFKLVTPHTLGTIALRIEKIIGLRVN